jgi:Recombination endonuclease VII
MQSIRCLSCKEEKDVADFGPSRSRASGIAAWCRKCLSERQMAWQKANPDKVKAVRAKSYRKWRELHPIIERPLLVTEEGRLCRTCNTRKPDSEFGKDPRSKNFRAWRCKECARAAHRRWADGNREHVRDTARASARKSRALEPSRSRLAVRKHNLKKKYGLSPEGAQSMLDAQDGKCGICELNISFTSDRVDTTAAHIDHDHDTGKLRGVLCSMCNTAIGKLKDSPVILRSALAYLAKYGRL